MRAGSVLTLKTASAIDVFTRILTHGPIARIKVNVDKVIGVATTMRAEVLDVVLTVNGTDLVGVDFQGSNDDDWNHPQEQKIMVHLEAGTNMINVGHPTWYVSDIDAFTI